MQFLAFLSLLSWDNFNGTSPITNNMADCSYDFSLVIKYKGQKSELWIYTEVIRQRSSYYYTIWVSGCCSRFLELLKWNKSAAEIHLNGFTCYPIRIQYASQYRIPVSQYITIRLCQVILTCRYWTSRLKSLGIQYRIWRLGV